MKGWQQRELLRWWPILLLLGCTAAEQTATLPEGDAGDAGDPIDRGRPAEADQGSWDLAGPEPDTEFGPTDGGAAADGSPDAEPEVDPALPISALSFPVPTPWAEPINDYLAVGEANFWSFLRGIHDLTVYQDRLYLAYGDANVNLGRLIPIEFRSFADPTPDALTHEFATDEEQVERYRLLGDELFVAGVDATEDAWLGNVYFRGPEQGWTKSRTLLEGVHVHDVALFDGAIYAVGSGAPPEEWNAGLISAHLWRSTDGGQSFTVAARSDNGGEGDARWVRLLPVGETLYLFGYKSNAEGRIRELAQGRFTGTDVEPLPADHPLARLFVNETDPIHGELGLVRGVDVTQEQLQPGLYQVDGAGEVTAWSRFAGQTVVDLFHAPGSEEVLLLTFDGNDFETDPLRRETWAVRATVCPVAAPDECQELFAFDATEAPASLAYWRGAIYYGTARGQIWRSRGRPRAE